MATNNNVNTVSKVTKFTGSGTWTPNTRTSCVTIFGMSGGCGGGSGRQGATTAAGGGGGGNTGAFIWCDRAPISLFSSSETVTIGGTSAGGTTQSSNLTNGNTAAAQNTTSIGYISAVAQTGLTPGGTTTTSSTASTTGLNFSYMSAAGPVIVNNLIGPSGSNSTGGQANPNQSNTFGAPYYAGSAGGGGGGADTGTARAGGGGANISFYATTIISSSAGGIETGTINGTVGTSITTPNHGVLIGGTGGGGGGGQKSGGSAGLGGDGGSPGGSGGGGGGSISGTNSGAGGLGQAGELWVIEFF